MSKRPTLKEVKKHFENAKEVRCLVNSKVYDISKENVKKDFYIWYAGIWIDVETDLKVWSEGDGYAEIITYKEKTFSLTADQLRSITDPQVKQWFPEVFETVLEVGKWYKNNILGGSLFCIESISENNKTAKGFGFECGRWDYQKDLHYFSTLIEHGIEPATESEVFEALKNEAVKRGFVEGAYFSDVHINTFVNPVKNLLYHSNSEDLRCDKGCVFHEGIWAEIIPTKTKSEAEKELNCKIVD